MMATTRSEKNLSNTFRKTKRPIMKKSIPFAISAHWYGEEKPSAGYAVLRATACPIKKAGEYNIAIPIVYFIMKLPFWLYEN